MVHWMYVIIALWVGAVFGLLGACLCAINAVAKLRQRIMELEEKQQRFFPFSLPYSMSIERKEGEGEEEI